MTVRRNIYNKGHAVFKRPMGAQGLAAKPSLHQPNFRFAPYTYALTLMTTLLQLIAGKGNTTHKRIFQVQLDFYAQLAHLVFR